MHDLGRLLPARGVDHRSCARRCRSYCIHRQAVCVDIAGLVVFCTHCTNIWPDLERRYCEILGDKGAMFVRLGPNGNARYIVFVEVQCWGLIRLRQVYHSV